MGGGLTTMTTTELIDLLKKYEHGGATGRPREITLTVNGTFMPCPHFYVSSTDDGLYTGICIGVSGDVEQETDDVMKKSPIVDVDTYVCAKCGHRLEHQSLLGDNILLDERYNYCPECGTKVNWDD